MSIDYNSVCQYNTIFFNNIKNNQQDIKLLKSTFEKFRCRVKVYQELTTDQFESAIKEICSANFTVYEYIVIVVLDNLNPYHHILTTKDGKTLRINNDLLVRILQNKTLADKKRLFIIQTNQNEPEIPPEKPKDLRDSETQELFKLWKGPTVRLYATSPELALENYWPETNAPASPFIKSFCKHFEKHAEQETIQYIYNCIHEDLENEDFIPIIEQANDVVYGMAMQSYTERDHFPSNC